MIKWPIVAGLLFGLCFNPVASAKDNFNQSLIEYNNTSSYITDKTPNTWSLSQPVTGYPMINGLPDYGQPVQLAQFTVGSIIKNALDGSIVMFAGQSQGLYVQDFKQLVYPYQGHALTKGKSQKLLAVTKKWRKHLSTKEVRAISDYTNNGYTSVNQHLRNPTQSTNSAVKKQTKLINTAINRFKTPFAMTIYRGISETGLKASLKNKPLKVGSIYQDAAFSSSSISHKIATGFQSAVVLKINIPAGYHGAYIAPISINSPEKEYLLKPNAKMVVTKVQKITTYYSVRGKVGTATKAKKFKTKPTKIKYTKVIMDLVQ